MPRLVELKEDLNNGEDLTQVLEMLTGGRKFMTGYLDNAELRGQDDQFLRDMAILIGGAEKPFHSVVEFVRMLRMAAQIRPRVQQYLDLHIESSQPLSVSNVRTDKRAREILFTIAGELAARGIDVETVQNLAQSVQELRAKGYEGPLDLETLAETVSTYGIDAKYEAIEKLQEAMSKYGRPDLFEASYAAPFEAARTLDVMLFGQEEVRLQEWHIIGRTPERTVMPRNVSVRVSRRNRFTGEMRDETYNDLGVLTKLVVTDGQGSVTTTFDQDGLPKTKTDRKGRVTTYRVSAQLRPGSARFEELERLVPEAAREFKTVDRIEYEDPETHEIHEEFRTRLGQLITERIIGTNQATVVNDLLRPNVRTTWRLNPDGSRRSESCRRAWCWIAFAKPRPAARRSRWSGRKSRCGTMSACC